MKVENISSPFISKINRLQIQGYKSIREMPSPLELGNLNILIGPNGVGKTNFISFFNMINAMIEKKLQLYIAQKGAAGSLLHLGQGTNKLSAKLYFGCNGYSFELVPTVNNSLTFLKESVYIDEGGDQYQPVEKSTGSGYEESRLTEIELKPINTWHTWSPKDFVLYAIKTWKVYHFHDTSDRALVNGVCHINDNIVLHPNGSNLAPFLYLMKGIHPKNYEDIRSSIESVAPFFENFILRPDPFDPNKIRLEWKEHGSDIPRLAHLLSDGTLRFILLVTLLLQPNPPETIIVDEPELGLHPFAINFLSSLIKSVSNEKQIILSTQSVTLVNQFDPKDLIIVDREDEQTVFKKLDSQQVEKWLKEYSLGDLWEKNWIGGRP